MWLGCVVYVGLEDFIFYWGDEFRYVRKLVDFKIVLFLNWGVVWDYDLVGVGCVEWVWEFMVDEFWGCLFGEVGCVRDGKEDGLDFEEEVEDCC